MPQELERVGTTPTAYVPESSSQQRKQTQHLFMPVSYTGEASVLLEAEASRIHALAKMQAGIGSACWSSTMQSQASPEDKQ